MRVSDHLKEDFCIMDLQAQDKEAAIREIAGNLRASGKIVDGDNFIKAVIEREGLGSTGIGHNVAIPHARTDTVKGFVIGFGRSKKGIEFNALDGQPVTLIFLMGADLRELNFYLRVLAELSKLLMSNSFRSELMEAQAPQEIIKIIRKFEKS
ncbi:MAG: PTS sugar transporter subunit IIA [Candidatus Omnitrophota bacterium]